MSNKRVQNSSRRPKTTSEASRILTSPLPPTVVAVPSANAQQRSVASSEAMLNKASGCGDQAEQEWRSVKVKSRVSKSRDSARQSQTLSTRPHKVACSSPPPKVTNETFPELSTAYPANKANPSAPANRVAAVPKKPNAASRTGIAASVDCAAAATTHADAERKQRQAVVETTHPRKQLQLEKYTQPLNQQGQQLKMRQEIAEMKTAVSKLRVKPTCVVNIESDRKLPKPIAQAPAQVPAAAQEQSKSRQAQRFVKIRSLPVITEPETAQKFVGDVAVDEIAAHDYLVAKATRDKTISAAFVNFSRSEVAAANDTKSRKPCKDVSTTATQPELPGFRNRGDDSFANAGLQALAGTRALQQCAAEAKKGQAGRLRHKLRLLLASGLGLGTAHRSISEELTKSFSQVFPAVITGGVNFNPVTDFIDPVLQYLEVPDCVHTIVPGTAKSVGEALRESRKLKKKKNANLIIARIGDGSYLTRMGIEEDLVIGNDNHHFRLCAFSLFNPRIQHYSTVRRHVSSDPHTGESSVIYYDCNDAEINPFTGVDHSEFPVLAVYERVPI